MSKTIELLAPAGGMEALKAALRFGADAVYGGMKRFGLRAFAGNYDDSELREATSLTHAQGRKFYVTLNALPRDEELPAFLAAARAALTAGVDAAIVADLGAALMLRQKLPELPLHISTQANVLNSLSAMHLMESVGARRIILSRELSLEQIRLLRQNLPEQLELEAFVHGAMCVSYSGRCLLSAALTGRSANQGACAQPCRWQYQLVEKKRPDQPLRLEEDAQGSYLLSAPDLCMLPHLDELADAGLCSLKIEGRMKTAYYVATVVSAYRRGLDLLLSEGPRAFRAAVPRLMGELEKASHRTFNTGFFYGSAEPMAGAAGFTQSMEYVGDVLEGAPAGGLATVRLKNRFYVADRLEALTPTGTKPFTVEQLLLAETGEPVSTAGVAGTLLKLRVPFALEAGDLLRGPNRNHQ